jgi:hypothetical protein
MGGIAQHCCGVCFPFEDIPDLEIPGYTPISLWTPNEDGCCYERIYYKIDGSPTVSYTGVVWQENREITYDSEIYGLNSKNLGYGCEYEWKTLATFREELKRELKYRYAISTTPGYILAQWSRTFSECIVEEETVVKTYYILRLEQNYTMTADLQENTWAVQKLTYNLLGDCVALGSANPAFPFSNDFITRGNLGWRGGTLQIRDGYLQYGSSDTPTSGEPPKEDIWFFVEFGSTINFGMNIVRYKAFAEDELPTELTEYILAESDDLELCKRNPCFTFDPNEGNSVEYELLHSVNCGATYSIIGGPTVNCAYPTIGVVPRTTLDYGVEIISGLPPWSIPFTIPFIRWTCCPPGAICVTGAGSIFYLPQMWRGTGISGSYLCTGGEGSIDVIGPEFIFRVDT